MAPLPPLETLRVFEVACRHGSYTEAARELHVTHSAVSQRIRQLEEELGFALFERQGNRMVPTPGALRLQAGVKSAFSELNAALGSLRTRRAEADIAVSLLPVMAARWLVPRLPRFTARFPRINLHIKTGQSLANFKSDGVDIAIRFGTGDWKGLRAVKLLDEECFPVCSPSLNHGRLPKDPASMLSEPLLIDRNLSWRAWFRSAGLELDRDIAGTSFTDTNALMEAAVTGQGGLPDCFRIQPCPDGLPGLADRRGTSHLAVAASGSLSLSCALGRHPCSLCPPAVAQGYRSERD